MKKGVPVYFPEFADFITAGKSSSGEQESLSDQLKPIMDKPWSRWSGATTDENYEKMVTHVTGL